MIEIVKMLVLSTGHLTMRTGEILQAGDTGSMSVPDWLRYSMVYEDVPNGWQIWCGESLEPACLEEFPDEIKEAVKLARKHGCDWIRYDLDGPQVEELPYEDW